MTRAAKTLPSTPEGVERHARRAALKAARVAASVWARNESNPATLAHALDVLLSAVSDLEAAERQAGRRWAAPRPTGAAPPAATTSTSDR